MFLITNHQYRPTRFKSFPEVNAIFSQTRRLGRVLVVEEIPDTMVLMIIIHQILKKGKRHCTIRSGIILRQNKKMEIGII